MKHLGESSVFRKLTRNQQLWKSFLMEIKKKKKNIHDILGI